MDVLGEGQAARDGLIYRRLICSGAPQIRAFVPQGTPDTRHPHETDTVLYNQALPDIKGKTFTSVIVYFPPGARAVPHRHGSAFVYAYVLEGTVRSQLAGQPARTYNTGQDWVERPYAHHLLTENISPAKPAKLLVIFISHSGAKLKINDRPK